ncbi:MAG: response regulator [Bacteroidales bacterium]|nr:response regulator [Bacteroidales bacterium]MBN2819034.1 response regulator [Bacteroidales bacterium]
MKPKILYVDDEIINLELFKINFEEDYQVITAESGFEALKIVEKSSDLSIIISDLKMPGMNGLEFISKAKEHDPMYICIMLTAFAESDIMMKAINEELIYRYLLKPWNREELHKIIQVAFKKYESLKN